MLFSSIKITNISFPSLLTLHSRALGGETLTQGGKGIFRSLRTKGKSTHTHHPGKFYSSTPGLYRSFLFSLTHKSVKPLYREELLYNSASMPQIWI